MIKIYESVGGKLNDITTEEEYEELVRDCKNTSNFTKAIEGTFKMEDDKRFEELRIEFVKYYVKQKHEMQDVIKNDDLKLIHKIFDFVKERF